MSVNESIKKSTEASIKILYTIIIFNLNLY